MRPPASVSRTASLNAGSNPQPLSATTATRKAFFAHHAPFTQPNEYRDRMVSFFEESIGQPMRWFETEDASATCGEQHDRVESLLQLLGSGEKGLHPRPGQGTCRARLGRQSQATSHGMRVKPASDLHHARGAGLTALLAAPSSRSFSEPKVPLVVSRHACSVTHSSRSTTHCWRRWTIERPPRSMGRCEAPVLAISKDVAVVEVVRLR